MKGKRFLSLLLCFVMVLGMLPGLAIPAHAATSTKTTVRFYYIMGDFSSNISRSKKEIDASITPLLPTEDELKDKNAGYYNEFSYSLYSLLAGFWSV